MTTQAPEQQVETPEQQAPTQTAPTENWEARYKGQQSALQRQANQITELQAQLTQKASELEQLRAQLELSSTEKTVAVSERDKNLTALTEKVQQLETELRGAKAVQMKVTAANKIGRPELISIIDSIPAIEDPELLEKVMSDIAGFADNVASAREKQILAGVTPTTGPGGGKVSSKPNSYEAWEAHVNSLDLGSTERARAMDEMGDWLEAQHRKK